ncbi:MAG TPA: hypothetical protein VGS97_01925 [Actinocrinis sp.]|uniref:hypothetical protein n=1 Tax=Actinocrinis sp. TaxID=1920516 RepID=UPI002DDD5145|nr:hypothetical protein [Actinocrinis sp.]HEV2342825.1 hypothetical protein [Actinocrinis sp.]
MSVLDWVSASCSLPTEQRPLRVAEWDALITERLERTSRPGPLRLRLELTGGDGTEERVRDLAQRESGCCSFFDFTVAAGRDAVVLDVTVDAVHVAVLDSLERRAVAAAGGPQ